MEKQKRAYKSHCLVLPYPTQGHINPMLQFSKRLQHKGIKVTVIITRFTAKTIREFPVAVSVEPISDGFDVGGRASARTAVEYLTTFQRVGSQSLGDLIERLRGSGSSPVDCIVYDSFLPWALDVARIFGLFGAAFFTQSCAVGAIYYGVREGLMTLPSSESEIRVPGLPGMEVSDLPSFVSAPELYPDVREMLMNQFSNVGEADWILSNTVYELEKEVVDWMAKIWAVRTIGPTVPSMYIDKQLQDDTEYGLCIFKPKTVACMNWLEEKPNGSVVYVSFGSLAVLSVEQMQELAWGLRETNFHFLWVVRDTEESKLPNGFLEETCENGLVVSWCPQLEVLAHKAIGCFVTHCGWNSTLEALSLGVPMVAVPQWSDQTTNAKFIADVWGVGIRARGDESGRVRREEIERCVREVVEGERGKEMKRNATKWRGLAREAVDEGGSSDRNIDEFAAALCHS
ncbi:flavonol 7-O-beta-glucosyltransferase UGT74F1-like [Actinidia eriantha]|uniref:flavonol 7-O-beta-glucosyltransferase UGT74F1-like n=1 Tax=Actinidia eriantha TaxID=165200 RepID=UPI002582887F|nr:flavonol 7-O-beta-glucosyltransferase UGT74F1-like [Actinidia eriantha]